MVASGPIGSVYEPVGLPPNQAWPPPCTVQDSTRTAPSGSVWTVRVQARDALWSRFVVVATDASAVASRAATILSALTGATIPSLSPWKTITGTAPPAGGLPPVRIAANAEATSCAAPNAIPEWMPTPA